MTDTELLEQLHQLNEMEEDVEENIRIDLINNSQNFNIIINVEGVDYTIFKGSISNEIYKINELVIDTVKKLYPYLANDDLESIQEMLQEETNIFSDYSNEISLKQNVSNALDSLQDYNDFNEVEENTEYEDNAVSQIMHILNLDPSNLDDLFNRLDELQLEPEKYLSYLKMYKEEGKDINDVLEDYELGNVE